MKRMSRYTIALAAALTFIAATGPAPAQVASPMPPPNTGAGATGPGALPSMVPGTNHIAGSSGTAKKAKSKTPSTRPTPRPKPSSSP